MKKNLTRILSVLLTVCFVTSCGGGSGGEAADMENSTGNSTVNSAEDDMPAGSKTLRVVATVFPVWDWTREILGGGSDSAGVPDGEDLPDGINLKLLLDRGVDMHSFQPTVGDIADISTCDLFLYVGGESDRWAADALAEAVNRDMVTVNLMDILGDAAKEEEPGTEERLQGAGHSGPDGQEPEYDEHVWLSLRNARLFCGAIADALSGLDPENAAAYQANCAAYTARLDALGAQYESAVRDAPVKALLFGDRFPFRYLAEDYGLDVYAAFSGCSAETEASFDTVIYLAGKVDELDLPAVLTIDGGDGKLARTIAQTAGGGSPDLRNLKVLELDSMQSVTREDVSGGETYLRVMERNLDVLRQALGVT